MHNKNLKLVVANLPSEKRKKELIDNVSEVLSKMLSVEASNRS